jgi:replication factor C small subunit
MAIPQLWVEKYRPSTLEGYVFTDPKQKATIEKWVKEKNIGHLGLSGPGGVGKTTLARLLVNELGVNPYDFLEINASRNSSIDEVRDRITNFAQMMPFGAFKIILLDEADGVSFSGQQALRGVIEAYSDTARFILTYNYPHRIIPALKSRCQGFHIEKPDVTEFTTRVATILINENVEFSLDVLDSYVRATYPDLRKCINELQQNTISNKLVSPGDGDNSTAEWRFQMVELFKAGKINDARALLCGKISADEMEDVYRFIYDNLSIFSEDSTVQDSIILIVKQSLVDHQAVADPEINLSACLIRIMRLLNK